MPLTTWTCHPCQQVFQSFSAAQRHANEVHHGARISVNVPERRRG